MAEWEPNRYCGVEFDKFIVNKYVDYQTGLWYKSVGLAPSLLESRPARHPRSGYDANRARRRSEIGC